MIDLTPGIHEFSPDEFLELVQQYDQFYITHGYESFMQIRVPTKWIKMRMGVLERTVLLVVINARKMAICLKFTVISLFLTLDLMQTTLLANSRLIYAVKNLSYLCRKRITRRNEI